MTKVGEEYEKAVYDFVKTLDTNAKVMFNYYVPDRDTEKPRQCDVWIDAKFGNFFPLSFYVSCKEYNRKIDQHKIESFFGEMYSRRATNGVIFSKLGFSKPAIEKAEKLGISCCRLFQNEPTDIKSILLFSHYACYPSIVLELHGIKDIQNIEIWNDLFNVEIDGKKVVDYINETYSIDQSRMLDKANKFAEFPKDWEDDIKIYEHNSNKEVKIKIVGKWRLYTARQEAVLYNGSYCYNGSGAFRGSFTGPPIDTQGDNPGPAWALITEKGSKLPENRIVFCPYITEIKRQLIEKIGNKPINWATNNTTK